MSESLKLLKMYIYTESHNLIDSNSVLNYMICISPFDKSAGITVKPLKTVHPENRKSLKIARFFQSHFFLFYHQWFSEKPGFWICPTGVPLLGVILYIQRVRGVIEKKIMIRQAFRDNYNNRLTFNTPSFLIG